MSVTYVVDDEGLSEYWYIFFSMIFPKGCRGRGSPMLMSFLMKPQAVSVMEHKKGGISHQAIYRLLGTTSSMSSIESTGFNNGRTLKTIPGILVTNAHAPESIFDVDLGEYERYLRFMLIYHGGDKLCSAISSWTIVSALACFLVCVLTNLNSFCFRRI